MTPTPEIGEHSAQKRLKALEHGEWQALTLLNGAVYAGDDSVAANTPIIDGVALQRPQCRVEADGARLRGSVDIGLATDATFASIPDGPPAAVIVTGASPSGATITILVNVDGTLRDISNNFGGGLLGTICCLDGTFIPLP